MMRAEIAEMRAFESWRDYQTALKRAIASLSPNQLCQRPIADQRTPGELVAHIVFGRALHTQRTLGEAITPELTPFLAWEQSENTPHTASELVSGLDVTWRVISNCIMRGASMDAPSVGEAMTIQTIWGLLDHDLPHAGELSLLLGAIGLPGVEI